MFPKLMDALNSVVTTVFVDEHSQKKNPEWSRREAQRREGRTERRELQRKFRHDVREAATMANSRPSKLDLKLQDVHKGAAERVLNSKRRRLEGLRRLEALCDRRPGYVQAAGREYEILANGQYVRTEKKVRNRK